MSSPGGLPEITSVTGGAGGVTARYQDMEQLAQIYDKTGEQVQADAWEDKGLLIDGDLVASAVLSPGSFAEAEAAVIAATVGPGGLASRAIGFEVDSFAIRACIKAYQIADDIARAAGEALDYALGFGVGLALPILVGGAALLAVGGAGFIATNPALAALIAANPDLQEKIKDLGGDLGGAALTEVQEWLESHPDAVQHLVNGGGGLLDGLSTGLIPPPLRGPVLDLLGIDPLNPTVNDAAGGLAGLFPDSGPVVVEGGRGSERELSPPQDLGDLMANLSLTNGKANVNDGEIDIQQVGNPPKYIVNIPGTDTWFGDNDVRDGQANLELASGNSTAYTEGIKKAMELAGVPEGADILLTGHSQGGMAAVHLAADPAFREAYNVEHVITAASPTAQVPEISSKTQVLSLENTGDVVPLVDGEDNPDQLNRTTVKFDARAGSVLENHDMQRYIDGGKAIDESSDPQLQAYLRQLEEDGYLGAKASGPTQTYTITRSK